MERTKVPDAPHAEVEEIWPRDGGIRIRGRVTGGPPQGPGTLVVRARGAPGGELCFPAAGRRAAGQRSGGEGTFDARIPLGELAAASGGARRTWDLYLRLGPPERAERAVGSAEELRLGRHLDDVHGKKKIFVYPSQVAGGARIEPFYTVKDNVSVVSRREGAA